ncbi:MAG TPA: hypothetical protein PKL67_04890, partial [Anaerolineae bacterium]|nr:hypothetical protein [Anaerolineae bacterium]
AAGQTRLKPRLRAGFGSAAGEFITDKDLTRQILILAATWIALALSILAEALPINGLLSVEIFASFPVYFTPAGYVFSIWRLIWLGWLVYGVYQALPAQRRNPRLRSIGAPVLVALAANSLWVLLWHFRLFALALLALLTLLAALINVYQRLRIGRASPPAVERWAVDLPFSIYLGWITVVVMAHVTVLLSHWGWKGFGLHQETWLVMVLAAALILATLVALTRADVPFLLVLAWAFAGIGVKHPAVSPVAPAAWAAAGYLLALVIMCLFARPWRRSRPAA